MEIQHNNTELTRLHPYPDGNEHSAQFDYGAKEEQLAGIIGQSEHCEQALSYYCRKSRLLGTPGKHRTSEGGWMQLGDEQLMNRRRNNKRVLKM